MTRVVGDQSAPTRKDLTSKAWKGRKGSLDQSLCSPNATRGNRWNDIRLDPLLPEGARKINQIVKSRAVLPPRAQSDRGGCHS
jgi:hypothetical protein